MRIDLHAFHPARIAARILRDALLLRGWSHKKAERFAKAKERRIRIRR